MKKGYVPGLSAVSACLSDAWFDRKQSGTTVTRFYPESFRIWCYVTATCLSAVFFFGLAGVAALVCRSPIEAGTRAFAQPTQRFGKAGCPS